MLSFSGSLKVLACEMRKGFNGLHALVSERLPALTNQNIADWTPAAYAKRLREEQRLQAAAS